MIFGENRKKGANKENCANRAFAAGRPRAENGHPWVRYSARMLRHSEGTVHMGQNFYFVSESPVFYTDCLGTLISYYWGSK